MNLKINNISLKNVDGKLTNGTLTSDEVSQKIKIITEKGTNQLKKDILNEVSNLSQENVNALILSIRLIDDIGTFGGGVLKTCFKYMDMLYESTENHLVSEILKIKVNSGNIEYLYNHLFEKRLRNSSIEMIAENFLQSNDIDVLFWCLNQEQLKNYNDLFLEKINIDNLQNIPANILDFDERHILTKLYCKLGTSEDILYYFDIYNNCLDETDIKLIVKRLCELHNKVSLIALSRYEIMKLYYHNIFESLSQIENISYDDICEIDFSKLSKNNKDEYLNIVCKNSYTPYLCGFAFVNKFYLEKNHIDKMVSVLCDRLDGKCIYKFAKEINELSSANISNLVKALSKTNSTKYIYKFAKKVKNISKDDISILVNAIVKTNDIEYIYLFLKNISNIKKEDKKLLKSKILHSNNIKFICLTALYIDIKLIKRLFNDKKTLYKYMVASNLFSEIELFEASIELFGGEVDTKKITEKVAKIDVKSYEMTIQDESKKKGKK